VVVVVLCHPWRSAPESRGLRREVVREGFRFSSYQIHQFVYSSWR